MQPEGKNQTLKRPLSHGRKLVGEGFSGILFDDEGPKLIETLPQEGSVGVLAHFWTHVSIVGWNLKQNTNGRNSL